MSFYVSIRTIAPPKENCPRLRLGLGSRWGLVLGLGATRKLPTMEIAPRLRLGFGSGLVLGLERAIFSLQNTFFREHLWATGSKYNLKTFFSHWLVVKQNKENIVIKGNLPPIDVYWNGNTSLINTEQSFKKT